MQMPLRKRLQEKNWSSDWPSPPPQILADPPELTPSGWWEEWPVVRAVARALQDGPAVPLAHAHAFLDRLEDWSLRHALDLTWPPTEKGMALALAHSVAQRDTDVLCVLAAHPGLCAHVLRQHAAALPVMPEGSATVMMESLNAWAGTSLAAHARPVASPAPSAPRRADPPALSPEIISWFREMLELLNDPAVGAPVKRERLGERFKHIYHEERADNRAKWFTDRFLPVLAAQTAADLDVLLMYWPAHQRVDIGNPVEWVKQSRLWAVVRDAVARQELVQKVLPALIDSTEWTFEQRYAMLDPMFRLARSREVTEERLGLWMGLGGNLDEEAPLIPAESSENSPFAPSQESSPVSARRWFVGAGHPVWDQVMAARPSSARPRPRP